MRHKYLNLGVLSTLLILFDQFTKYMVTSHVPLYASFRVIDKFFNITHIRNPGVAFGLFAEHDLEYKSLVFVLISLVAIVAILVIFHQTPRYKIMVQNGLILIFAGAVGNLIDRIRHKAVIDFLDFYYGNFHWPAFNVADSCITIGVGMMIADLFMKNPTGISYIEPPPR